MPRLGAALQLALLLSALPAQFFICRWGGSTEAQRRQAGARLLRAWRDAYVSVTEWSQQLLSRAKSLLDLGPEAAPGSPPVDTMMFDNDQGFFGASKTVRSPRPPYVFLRVGEVVMERKGHLVGVVVSWDPEMRAPLEWVNRMYPDSEDTKAERTPHYKVLFSGPGPSTLMVGYLPQTQLERISGTRPDIPTLENYFTHFDGTRFVMQPWLRALFPDD